MFFDPYYYPYASRRNVVFASRGMVATSQPLAAQAGLHILRSGGNAIDAAIATAASLTVLEPTSNGIGGDAFAQVWVNGKLYGLNASGQSPVRLNLKAVHDAGYADMPQQGVLPITIPGIPAAWAKLNERFGKLSLMQCIKPAIEYAENGFPVAPITAKLWKDAFDVYSEYFQKTKDKSLKPWFNTFAPKGHAPQAGSLWRLPCQAKTLATIAESGAKAFYSGELAKEIDKFMQEVGGFLRGTDLQDYTPTWVEPICTEYRGHNVYELPPNGQGIVCLLALNIMRNLDLSSADDPLTIHKVIESTKMAFVDRLEHIADPSHMQVDINELLHNDYGTMRSKEIQNQAMNPLPLNQLKGGTVYLATADCDGNMVSYIQSNYTGFGSGVVVPNTGIALQNRGACFNTKSNHPNCVGPQKLSYHTIIPGFIIPKQSLTQNNHTNSECSKSKTSNKLNSQTEMNSSFNLNDNDNYCDSFGPFGPFGMMGGFIQPQGHIMLMHRILDSNLNPQAALDAPRFRWINGRTVQVEHTFPHSLAHSLKRMGHNIVYGQVDDTDFGRGQIIWQHKDGEKNIHYMGGTEPRTDGQIAAY